MQKQFFMELNEMEQIVYVKSNCVPAVKKKEDNLEFKKWTA